MNDVPDKNQFLKKPQETEDITTQSRNQYMQTLATIVVLHQYIQQKQKKLDPVRAQEVASKELALRPSVELIIQESGLSEKYKERMAVANIPKTGIADVVETSQKLKTRVYDLVPYMEQGIHLDDMVAIYTARDAISVELYNTGTCTYTSIHPSVKLLVEVFDELGRDQEIFESFINIILINESRIPGYARSRSHLPNQMVHHVLNIYRNTNGDILRTEDILRDDDHDELQAAFQMDRGMDGAEYEGFDD